MATVIPFPSPKFSYAELARWGAAAAAVAGWWVQLDPETGRLTTISKDGTEYAELARGGPNEPGVFRIEPSGGRWELWDAREETMVATFRTLRETLESVCCTITEPHDAA
jgi:hypothetical protein